MAEQARVLFDSGYNCSESILLAFSKALGVECEAFPKVATPFGAGIGRLCQECGVLTGGVLAIGLVYGRSKTAETDKRDRSYAVARDYYGRFARCFGSVKCLEIQGTDLLNREEARSTAEGRHRVCSKVVREGAYILAKLLQP